MVLTMNKYAIAMGTAIAACAASVVLLILKCYGVHIEWAWVLMPVLIVAGVWFVVFLACLGVSILADMAGETWEQN